jgi:hypothetical protein
MRNVLIYLISILVSLCSLYFLTIMWVFSVSYKSLGESLNSRDIHLSLVWVTVFGFLIYFVVKIIQSIYKFLK